MPTHSTGHTALQLRPYQTEAISRLDQHIASGARRVLLVAPTGAGKCLTRDTFVWSRGLKRFGELWGAERILGPRGPAQVVGWYNDGSREGLEVTLECGLTIDATVGHRVWVRTSDGREEWRHVGELDEQCWVAGKLVEVSAESFAPSRKRSNATEFRSTFNALRNAARSGNRVSWELIDRTRTTSPPNQQQSLTFE